MSGNGYDRDMERGKSNNSYSIKSLITKVCRGLYGGNEEELERKEKRLTGLLRGKEEHVLMYALYRLADILLPEEPDELGVKDASGSREGWKALEELVKRGMAVQVGSRKARLLEEEYERCREGALASLGEEGLEELDLAIEDFIET